MLAVGKRNLDHPVDEDKCNHRTDRVETANLNRITSSARLVFYLWNALISASIAPSFAINPKEATRTRARGTVLPA